jgi:hypothetical protein
LWRKYNDFSVAFNVPRLRTFQEALLGRISIGKIRKIAKYVFAFQPWDILRSFILWHTWVQRCSTKYNTRDFCSEKVMSAAWVSTIHFEMAIKRDLCFRIQNQEKRELVLEQFSSSWAPVFTDHGLNIWNFNIPKPLM